jgi:hypothetical protein
MSKSILFVRGFATPLKSGLDDYLYIKTLLKINFRFVYFDYEPSELMDTVYKNLSSVIENGDFDILIGHSLGGGLLAKYLKLNPTAAGDYEKIILLMPFMCKNALYDLAVPALTLQLAFNPALIFPKALFVPSSYLFEGGNLLNSDYNQISFRQPYDLYTEKNTTVTNDVSFIVDNPNITVFYASYEMLNIIDESVLTKIPPAQLKRVAGLHECWRSTNINTDLATDFTTQLSLVLRPNAPKLGATGIRSVEGIKMSIDEVPKTVPSSTVAENAPPSDAAQTPPSDAA